MAFRLLRFYFEKRKHTAHAMCFLGPEGDRTPASAMRMRHITTVLRARILLPPEGIEPPSLP